MSDLTDDASSGDEGTTQFPQTYIVIKFASNVKDKALSWFVNKVRGRRRDGGAELLVRRQPFRESQGLILHISASKIKFLEVAEEIEIVKRDRKGILREFVVSQLEQFLEDGMHVDDFLTTAERQTIVSHELDSIKASAEESCIPEYSSCPLYSGKSVVQAMRDADLIEKIYPLHDDEILAKLGWKWYTQLFQKQPYEEIRQYFGDAVALYFIFIGFYTTALIFPTALGIIKLFTSYETLTFFCVFNVLWVVVFLETWKRKCSEYAFNWGTSGMTSLDEPRANFRGTIAEDPVTGKMLPQAPRLTTHLKMYCVSFPIVLICLCGGFIIMLWSFWAEEQLKGQFEPDSWFVMIPSIAYTAIVYIGNLFYRKFATSLTEWENHRTQSQYDRHRVIKLVLFEFVNNFMSLFYIAFVIQDMDMLKQQLATMLIILQAINHVQEAILPFLIQLYTEKYYNAKWKSRKLSKKSSDNNLSDDGNSVPMVLNDVACIRDDDQRIRQAMHELIMDDYEGTYDDYLEMFIQFGYVILFSSVYPLAALFAFINNIVEIRADAFKLCKAFKRPTARRVKDTGAWQRAFEILGAMSIMTNCGLLWLSPQMRQHKESVGISDLEWAFAFVFLEHLLIGVRYVLHHAIPDKPEWVRVGLARKNHLSKLAFKRERAQISNRAILRRYKSVYSMKPAS